MHLPLPMHKIQEIQHPSYILDTAELLTFILLLIHFPIWSALLPYIHCTYDGLTICAAGNYSLQRASKSDADYRYDRMAV
jgi:hypothetical protein